jgi:hypothetical protein
MKKILLLLSLIFSITLVAQVKKMGGPISWKVKSNVSDISPINLPSFDLQAYIAEDAVNDMTKDTPWRFGHKHQVNYSLTNSGQWSDVYNGRVWRIRFRSKNALTMNFIFENMFIPEGGHIHMYNAQKTAFIGAYTAVNNSPSQILGTDILAGDDVIIEYFEPTHAIGEGSLTVTDVVHGYRSISIHENEVMKGLNDSGNCNRDVRCLTDTEPLWVNESNAVAMIVVNGNGSCTGTLVNNTAEDGTPYFLTANHCLGNPATWAFRFKWISPDPVCAQNTNSTNVANPAQYQTMNGSVLRASNGGSDFALVEITNLDLATAAAWGLFYAGWDRSGDAVPAAIGIHHPSGDIMKYCREENALVQEVWQGAQCWRVSNWDEGVTEPGSSGSALFDYNHRIIGQLFGGQAACSGTNDNNTPDWYGRFDVSWNGAAANSRLRDWLDPSNSGPLVLDGFDPNQPSVAVDASIQTVNSPLGLYCQTDEFIPEVLLRNAGTDDLTSVTIEYSVDGGAVTTFAWTGLLTTNQTEIITLPAMTATNGVHTFEARTVNPNGGADANLANDESISNFTIQLNGVLIDFELTLDCWGDETSWELTDAASTVLYSGGPYTEVLPGGAGIISDQWCLVEDDCYIFTLNDTYGDGMNGTQWAPDCSIDGTYTITQNGTLLADMQAVNSDFGNQEVNNFCVLSAIQPNFIASVETLCVGDQVTFTDASTGVTTWDWDFGVDATPATITGVGPHVVTYTTPGVKTITLTGDGGATFTLDVTVNALPTAPIISADGPTTICAGESVNLTSSSASTHAWSSGETTASINVTTSGTFSVTIEDVNGCSASSATETVVVEALPVISVAAVNEPTTCATATGSISISGAGTGNISWSGTSTGNDNGITLPYTINGLAAGTYTVSFVSTSGCVSNALNQSISDPNAPPAPFISVLGATTFCAGDNVELISSEATGNTWSSGPTTQSITVTSSGSYTVSITDALGCSSTSDVVNVTVNPLPATPTISASGALTFCDGESVTLTSSAVGGNEWSTGATSNAITVSTAGAYSVTVTNEFNCSQISTETVVEVNELPAVSLEALDAACNTADPITLSGGAPIGGTYTGAGVSGGIFNPSVAGAGSHLITYTFTDGNGCQNSAAQTILVEDCLNLDVQEQELFAVYPNPATNELNIVGLNSDIQSVVMIDATGRVVLSNSNVINTNEILLNVSMLSNGVYTVSIYSENKAQHTRVVINK